MPYRLEDLTGTITIRPDLVVMDNMTAKHDQAKISLAGTGSTDDDSTWDLKIGAEDVTIDDEFRQAIPEALRTMIETLKLRGQTTFAFSKLLYRNVPAPVAASGTAHPTPAPSATTATGEANASATQLASTQPATEADVDWAGTISLKDATSKPACPWPKFSAA